MSKRVLSDIDNMLRTRARALESNSGGSGGTDPLTPIVSMGTMGPGTSVDSATPGRQPRRTPARPRQPFVDPERGIPKRKVATKTSTRSQREGLPKRHADTSDSRSLGLPTDEVDVEGGAKRKRKVVAKPRLVAKPRKVVAKAKAKGGASVNPWIEHVKQYARVHNIPYRDAMSKAKASYKR